MRIQLFSDLHLERDPGFMPQVLPGTDVVVVAGDIGSYQDRSRLDGSDFGLARFAPDALGVPGVRVLYVPGNHEFDALDYDATHARLHGLCRELGILWLDRETLVLDGVRFIGSTLWSDFDALVAHETDLARALAGRGKAFRAANYYLSKNTTLKDGAPVLAEGIRDMSLDCQAWLRDTLATRFDGRTVVVTHFAPSLKSADPRYGLTPGTAGFCNALDDLLPFADVWMHGHLHCANDYVVDGERDGRPWACRVVANPLGYANKGEQAAFRPELVVEI